MSVFIISSFEDPNILVHTKSLMCISADGGVKAKDQKSTVTGFRHAQMIMPWWFDSPTPKPPAVEPFITMAAEKVVVLNWDCLASKVGRKSWQTPKDWNYTLRISVAGPSKKEGCMTVCFNFESTSGLKIRGWFLGRPGITFLVGGFNQSEKY